MAAPLHHAICALFFFSLSWLFSPWATASAQATADAPVRAVNARLDTLTARDRAALSPLLDRGPIAFVGFANSHDLPSIVLATRVAASPTCVTRVLSDPARFPDFMSGLQSTNVESRRDDEVIYGWTWQLGLLHMRGRTNVMILPPPPTNASHRRSRLVAMQVLEGDLGHGRMLWRSYPEPGGTSLLVFSSRIDMRDANYLTRRMSAGGNSVNRSVNISLAYVMMMSVKVEAERRLGIAPPPPDALLDLEEPEVDLNLLAPLLARGDIAAVDLSGGRTQQLSVFSRSWRSASVVWPIMTNPESFGRSLVAGSRAEVVSRTENGATFDWSIPIPIVGSAGRMTLAHEEHHVSVNGVSGHLSESQWRFRMHRLPWGEAAVIGWSRFDPGDASWMIESLVRDTVHFREGLALAGKIMIVRSLRSRAWNR